MPTEVVRTRPKRTLASDLNFRKFDIKVYMSEGNGRR